MQQFLLLIREDLKQRAAMTNERFMQNMHEMREWVDSMARSGNYLNASALHDSGRFIGQNAILSDGPFIEAKESISGFILILADDLDHAEALAKDCPLITNGTDVIVEVRPMLAEPGR